MGENANLVGQAFALSCREFFKDGAGRAGPESMREGESLALLVDRTLSTLLGYLIYIFKEILDGSSVCFRVVQLVVAPKYRCKGLGRKLLDWVVHQAGESGCDSVQLDSRKSTTKFYSCCGGFRLRDK